METKDVIALLGIAASLIFNVVNLCRTNALRRETLRLDEFKRLRAPVDAAVTKLKSVRSTLRVLEGAGTDVEKLRTETMECNKTITAVYNELCDGLSDLDRSTIVDGGEWGVCLTSCWDDVCATFDGAYVAEKALPEVKQAIVRIIAKIDTMLNSLQRRLDSAIK